MQWNEIKQHVNALLCLVRSNDVFASHECETAPQFQKKTLDVPYKRILEFRLPITFTYALDIKDIGVFGELLCKVAIGHGKHIAEICLRTSLTSI